MALPSDVSTFSLTFGHSTNGYTDSTGAIALVGAKVKLWPVDLVTGRRLVVTHVATGQVIVPVDVTVTIDAEGKATVGPLPHTDNPTLSPVGFGYDSEWQVGSGSRRVAPRNKRFAVPTAAGATVDFDLLDVAAAVPGVLVPMGVSAGVADVAVSALLPGPSLTQAAMDGRYVRDTELDAASVAAVQDSGVLELPAVTGELVTVPASGVKPVNLMAWTRALARLRAGTGSARLLCVGDSTTMGVRASPAAGGVSSYPYQLAAKLGGYLAPASYTLGIPQQGDTNDQRWVSSAPWVYTGGALSLGWGGLSYYRNDNTGAGTLTYTPGNQADTIVVYYGIGATNPSALPVSIDGAPQTPINMTVGTTGIGKATFTVAKGTHTVTFGQPTGATGGFAYVFGVEAYVAAASEVRVANAGVGSSTSSGWVANGPGGGVFNGAYAIKAYAPDLTVIMLGINDSRASATAATLTANLTTLVTAAKVSGDAVLMSVIPADASQPGASLQAGYRDAVKTLASSLGCPFVNIYDRQGSYSANVAAGFAGDAIGHLSAAGYGDVAKAVFDTLRAVA